MKGSYGTEMSVTAMIPKMLAKMSSSAVLRSRWQTSSASSALLSKESSEDAPKAAPVHEDRNPIAGKSSR